MNSEFWRTSWIAWAALTIAGALSLSAWNAEVSLSYASGCLISAGVVWMLRLTADSFTRAALAKRFSGSRADGRLWRGALLTLRLGLVGVVLQLAFSCPYMVPAALVGGLGAMQLAMCAACVARSRARFEAS